MRKLSAVNVIVAINILVFCLWYVMPTEFMFYNFLVSYTGLTEGRIWTLITSVFSHNSFFHIFVNMYVLYGFGQAMESVMGTKRFVSFYLLAGILASLTHSLVSAYIIHDPDLPALGASGAVAGLILLFSLLFPREKILLLGIIPLPAIFGALVFVGLDIWGLVSQARGTSILPIGHGAHLGGAFTGLIFYFFTKRKTSIE
ncbi:rhomboid family intramembrane serine protease [Peredibacter starrii]|uniref:Rhomboid family intramembrane serine protease n=1 Tax=Peredibacter starrii TaxID=28202 RepID=A0AAX4HU87_9BACT|nr:rhomboid family intramembrane serine protease [Peredibacter starrii]WPU66802.1 rhomboid family intramembrane serine protease [Peredibacter starrii]